MTVSKSKQAVNRWSRSSAIWVGSVASIAAIGIAMPALASGSVDEDRASSEGASPSELDLAPEIEAVAASASMSSSWRKTTTNATAQDGARLRPEQYGKVKVWQGEFAGHSGRNLDIVVTTNSDVTESSIADACETYRAEWNFRVCSVSTVGDDVVRYVERAAQRVPGGWPVVTDDGLNRLQGDLYQLHQIAVYRPNGVTIQISEVVKGAAPSSARDAWTLSREELLEMATDSRLTEARINSPESAS